MKEYTKLYKEGLNYYRQYIDNNCEDIKLKKIALNCFELAYLSSLEEINDKRVHDLLEKNLKKICETF